ncbi:MAG: ABC transporter substrate-binding protein [Clostridiales bacterium]|nr:ABC transporter substrate-binding protein [Clostridiales bacterium]
MKKLLTLILAAALSLTVVSCGSKDDKKITVAASTTPHAEILEQCKPLMEEKGYTLEIKIMDDYVTPNTATNDGDVDANYFQHQPYLDDFNKSNGTKLVSVAKVHYEPYAIYAGTVNSLADIMDGAIVAVPNDPSNEARALMLLEANGLIKLKEGSGLTATKNDIESNPKNLDIREMEAALLPTVLDEAAIAVINGNYAINAGLKVADALAVEDAKSEAAQTYANVLVVHEGNENLDKVKALVEVLNSDAIAEYITNTYAGAVVSMK